MCRRNRQLCQQRIITRHATAEVIRLTFSIYDLARDWYVQLFFLCITVNTVIIPYSVLISSRWLDATYKDIEFKNSSNTWKDIQGSKPGMALNRTSPIWELRASLAIHSLPATQHKWTCPALTPASKLVRFTYPKGCKARSQNRDLSVASLAP